jgi:hypothetical protein
MVNEETALFFRCIRIVTDSNGANRLGCIFFSDETWFHFSSHRK